MPIDMPDYAKRIAELERENRILKQKLNRSIENRKLLEETIETHSHALKRRNEELEESKALLKKSESRYRFLAHHDSLTGLPNRPYFQDKLKEAMACARKNNTLVALLFIDLDSFKYVNDHFGHEVGDALLNQTGNRLSTALQMPGIVSRIGGDEFAILIDKFNDVVLIEQLCKRILRLMSNPFIILDYTCYVGASIGISIYPNDDMDSDRLLQKADIAMYRIKNSGANGFQFYGDISEDEDIDIK